jgi:hypothetical protein
MKNIFKAGKAKLVSFAKTTKLKAKKHAPEILVVSGIILTGAAVVMACKKTMNVNKIVENHKANLDKIGTSVEESKTFVDDDGKEQKYTKEVAKMDKFVCYRDTTFAFVKNYAIPAGLFIAGMSCFVASTVILKKREAAAVALFNGTLGAFNAYRARVKEAVGDEVEENIYHDIHETKYTELHEDGTQEDKTIKTVGKHSGNVYSFTMNSQTSSLWENDMEYNLVLVQSVQEEMQERVFGLYGGEPLELNYVLKRLGMLKEGAMMNVGWVPEKLGGSVKCVDFGLKKYKKRDEDGGIDIHSCDEIVLEFNCEYIADKF